VAAAGKIFLLCLLEGAKFLLDLYVRVHDLFALHGRKPLDDDLQWDSVDMPGLRSDPRFRQRLKPSPGARRTKTRLRTENFSGRKKR